ncbi:MAG TPA: hypothetical protein VHE53_05550 [Patescibacteria group bacterium]|nr:hypothetical protein [Patescibacteria group bacterium]
MKEKFSSIEVVEGRYVRGASFQNRAQAICAFREVRELVARNPGAYSSIIYGEHESRVLVFSENPSYSHDAEVRDILKKDGCPEYVSDDLLEEKLKQRRAIKILEFSTLVKTPALRN